MAREEFTDDRNAPTRVITADDDPFARRVIKAALQAAGLTVVAEAKNGREAVQFALHYRPDVVVMDVVMPELDGILATRQILKAQPDQLIVVLTGDEEREFGLPALQAARSASSPRRPTSTRCPARSRACSEAKRRSRAR